MMFLKFFFLDDCETLLENFNGVSEDRIKKAKGQLRGRRYRFLSSLDNTSCVK